MDKNLSKIESWVINLKSRPDRLQDFILDNPIEEINVFEAISPDQVQVPSSFVLTPGSYCNGLSHRALWIKLLESDADFMSIFEDDAVYTGRQIPTEVAELDIDILFLGGNHTKYGAVAGEKVSENLYRCRHTLTGHAYVISKRAAQWMIENHNFELTAIDAGWGALQAMGRCYYVSPSVYIQRPGHSDIWNRYVDYRDCIM